jgi:hypothetical protein
MRDALRAGRSAIAAPVVLAIICLLLCSSSQLAQAKTEEEWKERTVYQIVSSSDRESAQCSAPHLGQYSSTFPNITSLLLLPPAAMTAAVLHAAH